MSDTATEHPNIAFIRQAQTEAALADLEASRALHAKVHDLVIGTSTFGRHLAQVIPIGDTGDVVVAVAYEDRTLWAAVVDGLRPMEYHASMDEALVHLVSLRHGGRGTQAHTFACRVLNVPVHENL